MLYHVVVNTKNRYGVYVEADDPAQAKKEATRHVLRHLSRDTVSEVDRVLESVEEPTVESVEGQP